MKSLIFGWSSMIFRDKIIKKIMKIIFFSNKTLCTFIRIYERSPNPLPDWDMIRYFWRQKILKKIMFFEKLTQNQWNSEEINGIHRKSMLLKVAWRQGADVVLAGSRSGSARSGDMRGANSNDNTSARDAARWIPRPHSPSPGPAPTPHDFSLIFIDFWDIFDLETNDIWVENQWSTSSDIHLGSRLVTSAISHPVNQK